MTCRRGLCLALLAVLSPFGCQSAVGFGVEVTLDFDSSVDDATLASIQTIALHASGSESFDKSIALGRSAKRSERFVYRPGPTTISLTLAAEGLDQGAAVVADGVSMPLTITPGMTSSVTIEMHAGQGIDFGVDLSALDGPQPNTDGSMGNDDAGKDAGAVAAKTVSFRGAPFTTLSEDPVGIAVGDFNGDSLADTAVATAGSVQIFLTNADGTASETPNSTVTFGAAYDILALDFDADQHLDLVVLASDGVHLLHNAGPGTFTDTITLPLSGLAAGAQLTIGDLDNDGHPDLFVGSASSYILWGTGSGATTFGTNTKVLATNTVTRPIMVDLDGDLLRDLVCIEQGASKIETLHNTGHTTTRTFASPVGLVIAAPIDAVFDDDKGNGMPDGLLAQGNNLGHILVIENTNGTLSLPNVNPVFVEIGVNTTRMKLVDVDGDGLLDLVTTHSDTNLPSMLRVALGQARLQFGDGQYYAAGNGLNGFDVGDIDDDGKLDIAVIGNAAAFVGGTAPKPTLFVARGLGAGKLAAATLLTTLHVEDDATAQIQLIDFDKDGKVDLVETDANGFEIYWGDGHGGFTIGPSIAFGGNLSSFAVGDIDGDKLLDVVYGAWGPNVYVARSTGPRVLGMPTPYELTGSTSITNVQLVDLDGNGSLDIAAVDNGGSSSSVYSLLNSAGMFTAYPPVKVSGGNVFTALAGNLNGDKYADLLVWTSYTPPNVFLADGKGGWSMAASQPGGIAYPEMLLADENGDGELDLIELGTVVNIAFGMGDGSFDTSNSKKIVLPGAVSIVNATLGDIDGDGRADLVGNDGSEQLVVMRGNAASYFQPAVAFDFGPAALGAIAAGDVNGDGHAEVASGVAAPLGPIMFLVNTSR